MSATELVHLVGGNGTNWTAIAAGIAGIVGSGGFGLLGGWFADKRRSRSESEQEERRFEHERALHATDDLIAAVDDVWQALEDLGEKSATMRQHYLGDVKDPQVAVAQREADDQYQVARSKIARLSMRPRAPVDLVGAAQGAASTFLKGIQMVRLHEFAARNDQRLFNWAQTHPDSWEVVIESVDEGYKGTHNFQELARHALDARPGSQA